MITRKPQDPLWKARGGLEGILKNSAIVVVLDRNGKILETSVSYLELTGYRKEDVLGENFLKLNQPGVGQEFDNIWSKVLNGELWRGEMQFVIPPSLKLWLLLTVNPVEDDGRVEEVVLVCQDITRYKQETEDKAHWLRSNFWLEKVKQDYLADRKDKPDPQHRLSQREEQVLKLVAEGFPNKNIATRLNISVRTVEIHRAHLMRKLDIRNTAGLVKYALEYGYLS